MRIRKYLLIAFVLLLLLGFLCIIAYREYNTRRMNAKADFLMVDGIAKFVSTENNEIKVFIGDNFEVIPLRGVRITSFYPGYEINHTGISKKRVLNWLDSIRDLGANVILIPYIQPVGFYDALYEYNLLNENPIYLIHEISLNTKLIGESYDAFDDDFYKSLEEEVKSTIDVVHGSAILLSNARHKGLYIKDVSKFNLGYIIGANTIPELVSLTNAKYPEITDYDGPYYDIANGTAFEVFITKILNYAKNYEMNNHKQNSIYSYLTSIETDPFAYENETNLTKNANIDLNKIKSSSDDLFVSIVAQPNDPDFMDFENMVEYSNGNFYEGYLKKVVSYYDNPVVVSEIGMSSARGKSKINVREGYDRGNYEENEQGEILVELIQIIEDAGAKGVFVDSFQDNWGRISSFNLKRIISKETSVYWYDTQASDEAFGLVAYEYADKTKRVKIDGVIDEWENKDEIIKNEFTGLKVSADTSYLYLLIYKKDFNFNDDSIYIGIDTIPKIGSKHDDDTLIKMSVDADFIVELTGYNTSRIVTHERYNVFSYQYKYNDYIVDKQAIMPSENENNFSAIYLLNRKQFFIKKTNDVESTIYYETGKLVHGTTDIDAPEHNSLADFNKTDDYVELRIPWTILNFKDPIRKKALGDFYLSGINKEITVDDINFSLTYVSDEGIYVSEPGKYNIPDLRNLKYEERLKESYYMLKSYWGNKT